MNNQLADLKTKLISEINLFKEKLIIDLEKKVKEVINTLEIEIDNTGIKMNFKTIKRLLDKELLLQDLLKDEISHHQTRRVIDKILSD